MQYEEEKIIAEIQGLWTAADTYYRSYISPRCLERYKAYSADEEYYKMKLPELSEVSNYYETLCMDTIEWALPSLMKTFFGSEV